MASSCRDSYDIVIGSSEDELHAAPPSALDLSSTSSTSSPDVQRRVVIDLQQAAPPTQEPADELHAAPPSALDLSSTSSTSSPDVQRRVVIDLQQAAPPTQEPAIFVISSESDCESSTRSREGKRVADIQKAEAYGVESLAAKFDMVMTRAMASGRRMGKQPVHENISPKRPVHEEVSPLLQAERNAEDAKEATNTQFQVSRHGDNWEERIYGKKPSGHSIKKYVCLFPACNKAYARLEFFNHHRILDHPGASMVPNSKRGSVARVTKFMQSPGSPKQSRRLDTKQYAKRYGMVVKATVKVELLLQRACREHVDYYAAKKDTFIRNYVGTGLMVKGVAGRSKYPIIDDCTRYDGCCFCRSNEIGLEFEEKNDPGTDGQEHVSISSNTSDNKFEMEEGPHGMGSDGSGCSNQQLRDLLDGSPTRTQQTPIRSSDGSSDLVEQQVRVVGQDIIIEASDPLRHKHSMHGHASSRTSNSMTRRHQRRVI